MTSPHQRFPLAWRLAVALVTLAGLLVLGLAGFLLFAPTVPDSTAPRGAERTLRLLAGATSAAPTTRSIATLPTITPPQHTARLIETGLQAGNTTASRATIEPQRSTPSLPTVGSSPLPRTVRTGCDPAYPEERTCIPSGPPLAQPCAITDERNFIVLTPDPRRLDADGDGIGCEPISP
jgi:hypothetical protein